VLILVVRDDRQVRIEVGYGLEGGLTDLVAGRIVDQVMIRHFREQDWEGGIAAGVEAVRDAVRGEFRAADKEPAGWHHWLDAGGPMTDKLLLMAYFLGLVLLFSGWLWSIRVAQTIHVRWLAGITLSFGLVLPFLAYQHWDKMKRPFTVSALGFLLTFGSVFLLPSK
jgi:uncharacterized membrane protein YgcG